MRSLSALTRRNTVLFFKDKGMFFTALITPAILLVLYATFLGNVYRETFSSEIPGMVSVSERLIDAFVGGQLISSILAVSCVTVAFSSNMLMVQDRVNGCVRDLRMAPIKSSTLALSYYFATLITTLTVCLAALALCLGYLAFLGWCLTARDVLLLLLDVILLSLFGTALSSVISFFLSSQGQISAVGTIMSAGYGFICGAYMPISQFPELLQKVIAFLPGTYGTSLLRNHAMDSALAEMEAEGLPEQVIEILKDTVDCNLYFLGTKVEISAMYLVMGGATVVLILAYVLLNALKKKDR